MFLAKFLEEFLGILWKEFLLKYLKEILGMFLEEFLWKLLEELLGKFLKKFREKPLKKIMWSLGGVSMIIFEGTPKEKPSEYCEIFFGTFLWKSWKNSKRNFGKKILDEFMWKFLKECMRKFVVEFLVKLLQVFLGEFLENSWKFYKKKSLDIFQWNS